VLKFTSLANSWLMEIPSLQNSNLADNSEPCKGCCFTSAGFSPSTSKDIWQHPLVTQQKRGGWFDTTFKINDKGKQMNESLLIDFEEAGRLLGGLHPNTLRQRKGGTENLTHVSGFGRRVMLVREEVNALVESKIAQARAAERDRRKMLRRAS
jgi:hypothetical protein